MVPSFLSRRALAAHDLSQQFRIFPSLVAKPYLIPDTLTFLRIKRYFVSFVIKNRAFCISSFAINLKYYKHVLKAALLTEISSRGT